MRNLVTAAFFIATICFNISCQEKKAATGAATEKNEMVMAAFAPQFKQSQTENKLIMIDFYTDWCKWCKVLDEKTYADPAVKQIMDKEFVFIKYNPETAPAFTYEGKSRTGEDLNRAANVRGYPMIMFLEKDGTVIGSVPGFVPAAPFAKILTFIVNGEYKKQSLDDFINGL